MSRLAIGLAALAALLALEGFALEPTSALAQDGGVPRTWRAPAQTDEAARERPRRARVDGGLPSRPRRTTRPAPTQTASEPGPAQAIEPRPSEPQPSEPPSEPQPSEPRPSEPQPSEPQPSEPQPSEQDVSPAGVLDGGVPPLDGGASLTDESAASDAGVETSESDAGLRDAGPPDAGAPDGGVDAGPSDAAPAAPVAEPEPSVRQSIDEFFRSVLGQRDAERDSAARESEAPAPSPRANEPSAAGSEVLNELVREWLGVEPPPSFGLVLLIGLALLSLWLVDRAQRPLPERGLVPRLLGAARLALRLCVVLLVLLLASRLLPHSLNPLLLVTLAAAAIALGFGAAWMLLPDVVGGIVLLTEGRLKRGQWISGEGFTGTVEQVGPRVTLLRAADGALLAIPNRRMLKSPVRASDRRWHEIDVEIRTPAGVPAERLREALREAVLCSPYVPPDPGLVLARDPREPDRWRLSVRLIDARFTAAFEGQLLERVEESLAHRAPIDPESPADPGA